jgi:predicted nucleic acid-binding protein
MSAERVFVDTNVLVYARDASDPAKQRIAEELLRQLWTERRGAISTQVLNEYYVTVTQKLRPGRSAALAREDVRLLSTWQPIPQDLALTEAAWRIQDRYQTSWWDALIVAAAQRADCALLASEDLSHGMQFDQVRVVNPFRP